MTGKMLLDAARKHKKHKRKFCLRVLAIESRMHSLTIAAAGYPPTNSPRHALRLIVH